MNEALTCKLYCDQDLRMASKLIKKVARMAYCGLFVGSLIISWYLRQIAPPFFLILPWIHDVDHSKEWYQTNAILRISLGNFLFFMVLALIMIDVRDENDRRDSWQHGRWGVKIIVWFLLIICMFLMPNEVVSIYELLSKIGAGVFLSVQFVLLLDFASTLNDACIENDKLRWYITLLVVSIGCWLIAFTIYILLLTWFNPSGQHCSFNVIFISITMVLAIALAIMVMISEGFFTASVIFIYCAYTCYSRLSIEPGDDVCNGLHNKANVVSISSLILGMTTTIVSLFYSAFRVDAVKAFPPAPSSQRPGPSNSLLSTAHMDGDLIYSPLSGSARSNSSGSSEDIRFGEVEMDPEYRRVLVDALPLHHAIGDNSYTKSRHISYLYTRFHPILWFLVRIFSRWTRSSKLSNNLRVSSEDQELRQVNYSYTYFHLIVALASMYSATILSGWISFFNASDLTSASWTSILVNIIGWVTAVVYVVARRMGVILWRLSKP